MRPLPRIASDLAQTRSPGVADAVDPYDERFRYLFNSYYNTVGPTTVAEVMAYRAGVDERMAALLAAQRPPDPRGYFSVQYLETM